MRVKQGSTSLNIYTEFMERHELKKERGLNTKPVSGDGCCDFVPRDDERTTTPLIHAQNSASTCAGLARRVA